jgi:UDP-N-acetylmuramoylalanine--D-glutamate ligase
MDVLLSFLKDKKIVILGYGREGRSTCEFIRKHLPGQEFTIADTDDTLPGRFGSPDPMVRLVTGPRYLEGLGGCDLVIKSPGIPLSLLKGRIPYERITSQTDLFFMMHASSVVGITGTKGKSTTSTLVYEILRRHHENTLLIGNIGIPPFSCLEQIGPGTLIVFELSSHQLEKVNRSPHVSLLLNLYEEHLDHYGTVEPYYEAKMNIARYQGREDYLVYNLDHEEVRERVGRSGITSRRFGFSLNRPVENGAGILGEEIVYFLEGRQVSRFVVNNRLYLPGEHNLQNIMAAITATKILGVPDEVITGAVRTFRGLPHRLEYIGMHGGMHFYNDSIATIPQATMHAVTTLKYVDTLILGGKDRGIDYSGLISFLAARNIRNILFSGDAGRRLYDGFKKLKPANSSIFLISDYGEIPAIIKAHTSPGGICLLSPAAPSYDQFRNYEERGEVFKRLVQSL